MGFFYWGEENNSDNDGWSEPREIKLSEISHGHSPDKRGERTDKYGRQPILVKRKSWGGYVVHDGNDRLYYARQRGDEYIMAEVEEQDQPTKKRGFFRWE